MQPTAIAAGAAINPAVAVTVQDAQGNTVTSAINLITAAIISATGTTGAHLRGITAVTTSSGVAVFSNLSIDSAGTNYRLTATAPGLADGISSPFEITAAPASKLSFIKQPSLTFVGALTSFQVAMRDSLGNTATGAIGTIAVTIGTNPGSGNLSGTTSVASRGGVATFSSLSIDEAGTGYTLTASASGLTKATSASFDVVAWEGVSASYLHTCGVTTAGTVYCWGNNAEGQLGNGSTMNDSMPVAVSGGLTFVAVSAGSYHTCGLTAGGAAYCWGNNASSTPAAVSGGLSFTAVSAGNFHSCGLTAGGAAYCWGANGFGQLGDSSTVDSSKPVAVVGGLTFAAVSAGDGHSCGVTTVGKAYCWGLDDSGQLGDGTTTYLSSSKPVPVSGGLTFSAVNPGNRSTCGVTVTGEAYCWGLNNLGQLGDGSTVGDPMTLRRTTPVSVVGGLTFATVDPGGTHSCGLTTGGAAYCWGSNSGGQLGNPSTTVSSTPVPVSGGFTFARLIAGGFHSCGLTALGAGYCWGDNVFGELGNGTTDNGTTPVPLSGPER